MKRPALQPHHLSKRTFEKGWTTIPLSSPSTHSPAPQAACPTQAFTPTTWVSPPRLTCPRHTFRGLSAPLPTPLTSPGKGCRIPARGADQKPSLYPPPPTTPFTSFNPSPSPPPTPLACVPGKPDHSPAAAAPSPRRPPGRSSRGTAGSRGPGPPLSPPPPRLSPAPSPSAGAGGRGSLGLEAPPPPRAAARGEGREAPRAGPGRAGHRGVRALLLGARGGGVQPGESENKGGRRGRLAGEGGGLHSETASRRQRRREPPLPSAVAPGSRCGESRRAGGRGSARCELGTPAPDVRSRDCLIPAPRAEGRRGDVRGRGQRRRAGRWGSPRPPPLQPPRRAKKRRGKEDPSKELGVGERRLPIEDGVFLAWTRWSLPPWLCKNKIIVQIPIS